MHPRTPAQMARAQCRLAEIRADISGRLWRVNAGMTSESYNELIDQMSLLQLNAELRVVAPARAETRSMCSPEPVCEIAPTDCLPLESPTPPIEQLVVSNKLESITTPNRSARQSLTSRMMDFPAELHAHLARAIGDYADSEAGPADNERLAAAMDRACRHAHATGMLPEAMVIALRKSYDSVAATDPLHQARLANAYDRLLSGCLQAYFEEQRPSA